MMISISTPTIYVMKEKQLKIDINICYQNDNHNIFLKNKRVFGALTPIKNFQKF